MRCLFCGNDAGAGSMGGPNVCAPCDCGLTRDSDGTLRKWEPRDVQYKVLMGRREPFREIVEPRGICGHQEGRDTTALPDCAAGGDGRAQAGGVDSKGFGERQDGGSARALNLTIDEPSDGVGANPGVFAPLGEAPLLNHREQQVSEGFGWLALGHGETFSRTDGKKLDGGLDKSDETDENGERQEHEPGVIDQDSAGLAGSEPERNETMSTTTAPTPAAQLPNLPECPRCCGIPYEPDAWLCDHCVARLDALEREDAAEDAARELAEDREFWGTR